MMNDRPAPRQPPPPAGLCATCRQAEGVTSARGSRFLFCGRSRRDPAYPKYPVLPVVDCAGYDPAPPAA